MFNNDIVFDKLWKNPEKYLALMKQAKGVIASDDDGFEKLMNQLLFVGCALKDIINEIEWLEE